jgi:DNA-3-methyladenine glycosylase II
MELSNSAQFRPAIDHLRRVDPVLSELIRRVGPCTLTPSRNYFLTLVEAVVWQQLSWKAACAIHERLLVALGTRRPRPGDVLAAPRRKLLRAGLSRQKCAYLRELAVYFEENRFPKKKLGRLDDENIIDLLTEVKGVGRWTAEMFLIFGLNRLDVFPFGDLGLRKAIGGCYGRPVPTEKGELESITSRWRPYRTIATWYLWKSADGVLLGDVL